MEMFWSPVPDQMIRLAVMLSAANIPFEMVQYLCCGKPAIQISSPSKEDQKVDAVCTEYTYGGKAGLLEVMGSVNPECENDDVVGWLTAKQAFKYFTNEED